MQIDHTTIGYSYGWYWTYCQRNCPNILSRSPDTTQHFRITWNNVPIFQTSRGKHKGLFIVSERQFFIYKNIILSFSLLQISPVKTEAEEELFVTYVYSLAKFLDQYERWKPNWNHCRTNGIQLFPLAFMNNSPARPKIYRSMLMLRVILETMPSSSDHSTGNFIEFRLSSNT